MSWPWHLRRSELAADLRQWQFPRELRIAAPALPPELRLAASAPAAVRSPDGDGLDPGLLAALGTDLWRLRRLLAEPGTGQPVPTRTRRAFRRLEALWDACTQLGLEIVDHTGEPVPDHGELGIKTLAHQPQAGLANPRVIETVKPSLYFRRRRIQVGEVIVGTPESSAGEHQQAVTAAGPAPARE
jgi:hypothetical protein